MPSVEIKDMFGDHRRDGVHGFLPAWPFRGDSGRCADNGRKDFSRLVLSDYVKDGVAPFLARQLDACSKMTLFQKLDC